MRIWSAWLGVLVLLSLRPGADIGAVTPAAAQTDGVPAQPPLAARKPVRLTVHGIERVDDYAWLRDPNWRDVMQDPARLSGEINAYVAAENAYAETALAPLAPLRAKLVEEMKGRIEQTDSGVPLRDGAYAYWRKYVPGAEHPQVVRSRADGSGEEVLLDGNTLAVGKAYFSFGDYHQSPNHRLYAYSVDETGSESYDLRIRNIATRKDLPEVMSEVADFTWASDNATLFYVRLDADHRARFVYRHRIGTDPAKDRLIYEEKDLGFEVSVSRTRTGRFVVISTSGSDSSEVRLIDAAKPESRPILVAKREPNLRYYFDDWGDRFIIRTNADGAEDFKIVTAPTAAPGRKNWRDLVPHKAGRRMLSALPFARYLVSLEREDGLDRLIIRRKSDLESHAVAFNEEAYDLDFGGSYEFDTRKVRFTYSSPATPARVFDYDMESRERDLRKEQKIPSGHEPSDYVVQRLSAPTSDNEQVPITLLYRKGVKLDGSAPMYLEGYGAYGSVFPTSFNSNLFSLVDRGFVYAIAHVRGGLEKGERWRNAGRRESKVNTFRDFITVAEYLIKENYTAKGRIVARGDSAGGLLMGAVANMRPDLFAAIVARVPFVDVVNTMLDQELPLTVGEFPEWGNPIKDAAAYRTIAGYSPYDNVTAQAYPPMLVTAGISDPRVQYWEPVKWVAKLRAMKTNDSRIALVTRMAAGHFGAAGRFVELDEVALIEAFAIDVTGTNTLLEPGSAPARPASEVLGPRAVPATPPANAQPPAGGGPKR
jgi:oligopeptidase B